MVMHRPSAPRSFSALTSSLSGRLVDRFASALPPACKRVPVRTSALLLGVGCAWGTSARPLCSAPPHTFGSEMARLDIEGSTPFLESRPTVRTVNLTYPFADWWVCKPCLGLTVGNNTGGRVFYPEVGPLSVETTCHQI